MILLAQCLTQCAVVCSQFVTQFWYKFGQKFLKVSEYVLVENKRTKYYQFNEINCCVILVPSL